MRLFESFPETTKRVGGIIPLVDEMYERECRAGKSARERGEGGRASVEFDFSLDL